MAETDHSEKTDAGVLVPLPLHDIAHAVTTGVMRAVAARTGVHKPPHRMGGCFRLMFWVEDGTTHTATVLSEEGGP
jgi:hypothetical protein